MVSKGSFTVTSETHGNSGRVDILGVNFLVHFADGGSTTLPFYLFLKATVLLLLLLLSRFSHVRLCATPQTAAHQAPPSLGFSRQEHWGGLPFPSPCDSLFECKENVPFLKTNCDGDVKWTL